MKRGLTFLITLGMVVFACGSKDHSESADEISGAYVREYSFKIVRPETGAEIGMRTIRDTILIRRVDEKFEISNHKWGKNDFDSDGWRNMEHSEDRPKATFIGEFDSKNQQLNSPECAALHFAMEKSTVFWKSNSDYHKVKR